MTIKPILVLSLLGSVLSSCGVLEEKKKKSGIIHTPEPTLAKRKVYPALSEERSEEPTKFVQCFGRDFGYEPSCSFPYLDLSGTKEAKITTILQHTLISDDWQTARFRTYLENAHAAVVDMFSCVKAIQISGDIRPAHFKDSTDAIYLDALDFALTEAEEASVDPTPDFRSKNTDLLGIASVAYMSKAGKIIPKSLLDSEQRGRMQADFVLIHELAHACDFKAEARDGKLLSDALPEAPRNAAYDFAQWTYLGDEAARIKLEAYSAADIGAAYASGSISAFYGYTNKVEHLASIVQQRLFLEIYGVSPSDFLFAYEGENQSAQEKSQTLLTSPILWKMNAKICDPDDFKLATDVTEKILPTPFPFAVSQENCQRMPIAEGSTLQEILDAQDRDPAREIQ